jgi:hypothetical protein
MEFMTEITKEDVDEAFFNLGRLQGRLPLQEAKRMEMIVRVITGYMKQLEKKDDDFDMDGRC